jgi:hypothetical protein
MAGIAFTALPPTPETAAADAVARILGAPLWAPDVVTAIVVVGVGAGASVPVTTERGIAAVAVEPAAGASDLATLAVSTYEALLLAARPPEPPLVSATDTSVTSR